MKRNVHISTSNPLERIARQIKRIGQRIGEIDDILSREAFRAKGYSLEYRTNPTPGLYLVNKKDNDPNFGTATLLGP